MFEKYENCIYVRFYEAKQSHGICEKFYLSFS
jgi:hypothetical protein